MCAKAAEQNTKAVVAFAADIAKNISLEELHASYSTETAGIPHAIPSSPLLSTEHKHSEQSKRDMFHVVCYIAPVTNTGKNGMLTSSCRNKTGQGRIPSLCFSFSSSAYTCEKLFAP